MKRLGLSLIAGLLASCSGTTAGPAATATAAAPTAAYDILITNGLIYDGSGAAPYRGEVGIKGDRITFVGAQAPAGAVTSIDAGGKAVAPGFINMLSHSREALLHDGRAMAGVLQGVTLEVNSESSLAPLTDGMRKLRESRQGDIKVPITWSTLGGYFDALENSGVSLNVASFIAAGSIRENVLGLTDVDPTPAQLDAMRGLVRAAMHDGAMGVATMLIYIPETYAETPELVALAGAAAQCGGTYAAHIRDEGDTLIEALEESAEIGRQAKIPVHVHHLKQSDPENWGKLDAAIATIERARASGVAMTADMYTYPASGTGANSMLPAWVQEGGLEATIARLKDPAVRKRAAPELDMPGNDPANILFSGFKNDALKPLTGKRLSEVMAMRGTSAAETVMDLIVEDNSRVNTIFFAMSEDNVRRQTALPWVAFGSDAAALTAEGAVLKSATHPRAYGNVARLLGKYVREEKTMLLEEAVRKLTSLPASILHLNDRGALRPGMFADVVVFDPATVADHATFADPHRYSTGVSDLWVNGVQVVKAGAHTGAKPGRAVKGRGCQQF